MNESDTQARTTIAIATTALISSLAIIAIVDPRALPVLQVVIPLAMAVIGYYFLKR